MSYSKDGKDWLGNERVEHFDDKGNKVGTSKDGKDWLGNERVEHFDDKGNKVGISKDGKDWLGNERAEHFDDSGKKTGISKSEKDIFGNDIVQHYDNKGNKTKYTKAEKNWLGQTIFRHRSGGGSGDGLYGIIAVIVIIVLIVVAVLGTFSYPFKIIDPNISPFELDWTSNENVWIFCCSFWILVVLSLLNIKKLFQKNTDNPPNESTKIKQTIILVLITTTLLMVIQYFIKSRFHENYLLISISLDLLIVGALFFINKGSKFKFYLLGISLITSAISLIYINQKTNILVSQNQVESQNISVNNDKDSKELVGNSRISTGKTEVLFDSAANIIKIPDSNDIQKIPDYIASEDDATNSDGDIIDFIGKPIKIENLEVTQNDFPKQMNLNEAKIACKRLGSGWRLPTKEELNTLYLSKNKIGGFADIGVLRSSASITRGTRISTMAVSSTTISTARTMFAQFVL